MPENSKKAPYFFQEPEKAKTAHIQAPEKAKMVYRFFMQSQSKPQLNLNLKLNSTTALTQPLPQLHLSLNLNSAPTKP